MTAADPREPGSPSTGPLLWDGQAEPVRLAGSTDLGLRLHQLRAGRGLHCTPGAASIDGGALFACVFVWCRRAGQVDTFLALAAGPGADDVPALLHTLSRTAARAA